MTAIVHQEGEWSDEDKKMGNLFLGSCADVYAQSERI
jgi:hypothetical protein